MRPKVIVVTCGALGLLALALYLALPKGTEPKKEEDHALPAQQEELHRTTLQVVEPQKDFAEERNSFEIPGRLQWILVNPSRPDGLCSIAAKTTEDWDILLIEKWDVSQRLELKLTHAHPASHVRVAISDLFARQGPFRLGGDASSIIVRSAKNRDPDGFGSTVRMTSGHGMSTSASLSGAVMIEFFYE